MNDLLYVGKMKYWHTFLDEFTEAFSRDAIKFNPGYDEIHQWRVEIDHDVKERDYFLFLLRKGWVQLSFVFQCAVLDKDPKRTEFILGLLKKVTAEKEKEQDDVCRSQKEV